MPAVPLASVVVSNKTAVFATISASSVFVDSNSSTGSNTTVVSSNGTATFDIGIKEVREITQLGDVVKSLRTNTSATLATPYVVKYADHQVICL